MRQVWSCLQIRFKCRHTSTCQQLAGRSRSRPDFASTAFRPTPGRPRGGVGSPMQLALWPAGTSHLCILPSSSPMEDVITCSNPFRVSGASAWFLGSRRGTLGWEIRQPPRYYKQLLLITRAASSPLSAHNLTRNRGAYNDDVGGNFQFQALLGRLGPISHLEFKRH